MEDKTAEQPKTEDIQKSFLEELEVKTKRAEDAAKKMEENTKRQEELEARRMLGGKTTYAEPEKPKVETAKEYTKRIEQGIKDGLYK